MPCQCALFQGRWVGGGVSLLLAMWLVVVVRLTEGWCCECSMVVWSRGAADGAPWLSNCLTAACLLDGLC